MSEQDVSKRREVDKPHTVDSSSHSTHDHVINPPPNLGKPPSARLERLRHEGGLTYAEALKKPKASSGPRTDQSKILAGLQKDGIASRGNYSQVTTKGDSSQLATDRKMSEVTVTDKGDASNSEVNYAKVFKDFLSEPQEKRTIERIIALIPKNALGGRLTDKEDLYELVGFEYLWTDPIDLAAKSLRRREWGVRVHEPNPRDPKGCPTEGKWTLRIYRDNYHMDMSGELRRYRESPNKRQFADNTHIPIQDPNPYVCPITHPEYYNRLSRGDYSRVTTKGDSSQFATDRNVSEVSTAERDDPWRSYESAGQEIKDRMQFIDYEGIIQNKQVVFLGDTHTNTSIRQHLANYAQKLKEAGITHYAIEASDTFSSTFNKLNSGQDTDLSGVDLGPHESVFGGRAENELAIRAMSRVGIKIVPIDIKKYSIEEREEREAHLTQNLVKLLESNPGNKVAVFVGAMHAGKKVDIGQSFGMKISIPSLAKRITDANYSTASIQFTGGRQWRSLIAEGAKNAKLDNEEFLLDMHPYASFSNNPYTDDGIDYVIHLAQSRRY